VFIPKVVIVDDESFFLFFFLSFGLPEGAESCVMKATSPDADVVSGGNHSGYRSENQDQMCAYIYIYYRLDPELYRLKKVKDRIELSRIEVRKKEKFN